MPQPVIDRMQPALERTLALVESRAAASADMAVAPGATIEVGGGR